MKINGRSTLGVQSKTVIIPMGDGEPFEFTVRPVLNMDTFKEVCPEPVPPTILKAGGETTIDFNDKIYVHKLHEHNQKFGDWLHLQCIQNVEWDTVDLGDSDTWKNWRSDLKNAGFPPGAISRLMEAVSDINLLDQEKLDRYEKDFLSGRVALKKIESTQSTDPVSTSSGEPASDSE